MGDSTTPADLSRELEVPQKRIRELLRSQFGTLPPLESRWSLTEMQADLVRAHFASPDAKRPLAHASVSDLLIQYAEILTELRSRGVVRTVNAPLGDYAEYAALSYYGGALAPNSARSYDITSAKGARVQVKAGTVTAKTSPSAVFSVFRTFDFDVATLLVFNAASYELLWARELGPDEVQENSRWSQHVNGYLLRIRKAQSLGVNVTQPFERVLAAK